MADVFISYSQRSAEPTRILAEQLKAEGLQVWWDSSLTSGQRFDDVIRAEIEGADAVVVIWTPESVKSKYVRLEAGVAYAWEKLITVRTADLPFSDIPAPFRTLHTDLVTDLDKLMIALGQMGVRPKAGARNKKMSKEEILAALAQADPSLPGALEHFLKKCQDHGFRVTAKRSLMIKAMIPNFGEINLGTFLPEGKLHTNYISDSAARISDPDIAADYLDSVARLIDGATVRRDGQPWTWRVEVFGELPAISRIIVRGDDWIELMKTARRRFVEQAQMIALQPSDR
jgi:hypothetical protein